MGRVLRERYGRNMSQTIIQVTTLLVRLDLNRGSIVHRIKLSMVKPILYHKYYAW